MFEETRAMFIYCISPVHMGSGTAVGGLIDNPIQRERHTEFPMLSGSGVKGAVRHDFLASVRNGDKAQVKKIVDRLFGPESSAEYAGAVSFTDAQIVLFPVRSVKRAYVYATCGTALGCAKRAWAQTKNRPVAWSIPDVKGLDCLVASDSILANGKLALEAFEFQRQQNQTATDIGEWLSENVLPLRDEYKFFRDKIKTDLVILSDDYFGYFARNATVVEPHVRIDNNTGTAQKGGLFYSENLPPESLLLSLLMASKVREPGHNMSAADVIHAVTSGSVNGAQIGFTGLNGRLLQIGGDATTGRGQVVLTVPENVSNRTEGSSNA